MNTNKQLYYDWAAKQEALPIFMQPWWMDTVCAGLDWDVLLSRDTRGEIVAAMPYLMHQKWGLKWIDMPEETRIGGIWMTQNGGLIDGTDEAIDVRAISEDFDRQLKALKIGYFHQYFPIGNKTIPALQALGFRARERHTYRVEDMHDWNTLIEKFSKEKQQHLQHSNHFHIERGLSAEEFYRALQLIHQQQRRRVPYSREFILLLDRKARKRKQSETIAIRTKDGTIAALAYLVWDTHNLFYLTSCQNPLYKDSGVSTLLAHESMRLAHEKGLRFDFACHVHASAPTAYAHYAAQPATLYSMTRCYNPLFVFASFAERIKARTPKK